MKESSNIRVQLSKDLHWKFKNKCSFYDLDMQNVLAELIDQFLSGRFDEEFNILKD